MKSLALFAGSLLMIAAVRQSTLPDDLQKDLTKLHEAKSLKVNYSLRAVGEAPGDFKLTFSKPNLFLLEGPEGFTLSDGKQIYRYTRSSNAYTKTDVTEESIAEFLKTKEVFGWAAFFAKEPGSKFAAATDGPGRNIKGVDVQVVDFAAKGGKESGSIFIDPSTGVTQGFDLKQKDKEYLAIATKVDLGSDPVAEDVFAFKAPDGSKETTLIAAAPGGGWSSVSALLNANCMPCHDSAHHKADVDLSSFQGVSAIVTAGDAPNSLLVKSVYGNGVDLMPKGRSPLTADQIHSIEQWITAGAKQE